MFVHIQYWEAQLAWRRLFLPAQVAYFQQMHQIVVGLHEKGIHLINAPLEERNLRFLHDRYLLIWRMSSPDMLKLLNTTMTQIGWADYFREIVLANEMIVPPTVMNLSATLLS